MVTTEKPGIKTAARRWHFQAVQGNVDLGFPRAGAATAVRPDSESVVTLSSLYGTIGATQRSVSSFYVKLGHLFALPWLFMRELYFPVKAYTRSNP